MDYADQDGDDARLMGVVNGEMDDIDGLMMDAIRGQEDEYGDEGEDYYDEEELDLQEQEYVQQLAGQPDGRADHPYVDDEFDQLDQQQQ